MNIVDRLDDWAFTEQELEELVYVYNLYKDQMKTGYTLITKECNMDALSEYGIDMLHVTTITMPEEKFKALPIALDRFIYKVGDIDVKGFILEYQYWMDEIMF